MNEQKAPGGIEWTRIIRKDLFGNPKMLKGFTWNPTAGCFHDCKWTMPDGTVVQCYAKTIAEKFTRAFPEGFESHYWREHTLRDPLKVKDPAGIFVGSMADLFGKWVPQEQVLKVFDVMRAASWHTFQTLSKNPYHMLNYKDSFPRNVWVGVSSPQGNANNKKRSLRSMEKFLSALRQVNASIRFISFEPIWFDVTPALEKDAERYGAPGFEWAITGAASSGPKKYQPDPDHINRLLDFCDRYSIPVFFKGNLKWEPWRNEFPEYAY